MIDLNLEETQTNDDITIANEFKNKMYFLSNTNKLLILDPITKSWEKISLTFSFTKRTEFLKSKEFLFKNFSACVFI